MAEVDTSSYPKLALPTEKSPLEQAKQYQELESGALTINKQKLDQANQALGYMTRAMSSLGPDASKEQYLAVGANAVKMGLVPPNMLSSYSERLAAAPSPRAFYDEFVTSAATHQEAINYHLGQPGIYRSEQTDTPIVTSPKFGMNANGLPIQRATGPGQEVVDNRPTLPDGSPNPDYGTKRLQGPSIVTLPPGATPANTGIPGQYIPPGAAKAKPAQSLPMQPNPVRTTPITPDKNVNLTGPGKTITGVEVQDAPPATFADRFPGPSGPAVGMPPLFEEGKKNYNEDQALATQKLTSLKPMLAAIDLMKDLRSGPGTETWNKAVAVMKANNIISTTANDPTAIYQEIDKYLNQFVSQNGTRSDADLAQREISNPNVTQQINPALLKLSLSTLAQERIQAARPGAFEGGSKLETYGKHRSTFPAQMDPRAFNIDKLMSVDPDAAQKLLADMYKKRDTPEGKRFIKSLEAAKRSGVLGAN